MTTLAYRIHKLLNSQIRYNFLFEKKLKDIPKNGIYIMFEKGEKYLKFDRIVRVGTHTGNDQLRSRLKQHFVKENKNRSILRKNIGRCFLNMEQNSYLSLWELDLTSTANKRRYSQHLDLEFEKSMEQQISEYIQKNLTFCVIQVDSKEKRLYWESKIASTLAQSCELKPSSNWLGNFSTKKKVRESGLWQVNELFKESMTESEFENFKALLNQKC